MLELPVRTLAYIGEADPVSDMEAHFPELKFPLFSSRLGADIIEVQASRQMDWYVYVNTMEWYKPDGGLRQHE